MNAFDWAVPIALFIGGGALGASGSLTMRVVVPHWDELGKPVVIPVCYDAARWDREIARLEAELVKVGGTGALAELDRAAGAPDELPFPDDVRFREKGVRAAIRGVLSEDSELSRLDCSAYPCVATVHAFEGVHPNVFRKQVEEGLESRGYVLTPAGKARIFDKEGKGQIYTIALAEGPLPSPVAEAARQRIDQESNQTVSDLFPVIVP